MLTRPARAAALALLFASAAVAQPQSGAPAPGRAVDSVARHPDVLGAQRLFAAWLEGQMLNRGLPGIVVGVVADQELVWAQGFGHADVQAKRPMTPATKFRMASHSKLFTATAIMQLRERGKVRLDDPVSQHLPWFRVKPAADDDGPITVEQLLTHASGLPREAGPHWTTREFPTAAEVRALMAEREAPYAPAVRWKYSNLAYTVAGMVVEQASGLSWADYVQRHIFDPLGMTSSSVDRNVEGLAVGYGPRKPDGTREQFGFVDARGMAAATGLTSTVGDMARFVSAQFRKGKMGGAQILSTGSLREMHRVRSLENDWSSGSGIGFAVQRVAGKTLIGHGGGYPGYLTQTLLNPETKVGVIVLTNAGDAAPNDLARQLMNTVGEAVAKASAVKPKQMAWDPAWERFAGLYRGPGGTEQQVVLLNQRLVAFSRSAPNLDAISTLEPIGDGRFRLVLPTGGGPVGEVVRFVEEGGRVVRMITGDSYVERVP
jgi:CubicO group peptidase (beta-lactamase class C family)